MILYLVRHGETAYNRDSLGLGRADVALTDRGLHQAAALGARFATLTLDRVLTSPLLRARQTAGAIAGERGLSIDVRDELLELDVGETEGMHLPQLRERYPEFLAAWLGPEAASVRMPGGESLADVAARLAPLVLELQGMGDEEVAVVSHNFVTKVLICLCLGLPLTAFRSFATDVASVTTLRLRGTRALVTSLNDRCHLDPVESSSPSG
ncbi:MAG: histidine phosphatase family protein [Dehalococcoidia bacterium]|nr:histidine phosphatase family protein [Dehalococcoidia bacterium]